MLLIFAIPVFYMGAIFFGYSSISYLKKKHKLNILWLSLSGFIIGAVITILGICIFYITNRWDPEISRILSRNSLSDLFMIVLAAGESCAFGAFLFGLISGITKKDNISLTKHSS